jgi:histone acetyltransferase 1
MGYCTIYRFFHYPLPSPPTTPSKKQIDSDAAEPKPPQSEPNGDGDGVPFEFPIPQVDASSLPCRSRISQFLILPPFQNSGLGSLLYSSIYEYYLSHPQTVEITVEDPNESFDDLRDLNDLKYLRENEPEFLALRINTSVQVSRKGKGFGGKAKASVVPVGQILDLPTIDSLRHRTKLAPRQFQRLVEMHLLSLIPSSIRRSLLHENPPSGLSEKETREWEHEYRLWGLVVKQRLYRHNRDMLMQLEARERVEKLEEAAGNVELDYGRLLGIAKHRARRDVEKGLERSGEGGDGEIGGLKRRAEGGVDGGSEAKKVRLTEGNGEV